MSRRLTPEERAVWRRVTETVRHTRPASTASEALPGLLDQAASPAFARISAPALKESPRRPNTGRQIHNTLDGSWDKRLSKGAIEPDRVIDLHGETLATAHAKLNRALSDALRNGARIVLLVTGKPAVDNPRLPPTSRGVIRASVKDWLAASPHSSQIAAVRNAHPRHGGQGALYVILKRAR